MNPNGQKQLWSKWTFKVRDAGRIVSMSEVKLNFMRWACKGFGSAGTTKIVRTPLGFRMDLLIEGPPAHDPGYVSNATRAFASFVGKGWGILASSSVSVRVVAGDVEDGRPRAQMVMMPHIGA